MATTDQELAFLISLQAGDEVETYEPDGVIAEQEPPHLVDDSSRAQGASAVRVATEASDPDNAADAYSPSAIPSTDLVPPSASSDRPAHPSLLDPHHLTPPSPLAESTNKSNGAPCTRAGFVLDDEDGDEDSGLPATGAMMGNAGVSQSGPSGTIPDGLTQASSHFTPDTLNALQDVPIQNLAPTSAPELLPSGAVDAALNPVPSVPTRAVPKARLPHDRVGILEDRIKDDPRGDLDAWLSLIGEHRKRNKLDDARAVYERFLKLFPMAAEQWVAYANMELAQNDFYRLEQIFNKALLNIPSVQLWSLYLDYVRRRNNLTTDTAGTARTIVSQAYDFVLRNVGIDKDSGNIWQDYVQFIRAGPGMIGGGSWQDQQKMDQLRKTYQRAICIPTSAVNVLWKEYDSFEMGLNKMTGRKFLQEKSPAYMTARSSNIELENITRGLNRSTLPRLRPALGFEGDEEYLQQIELWKRWIQWEKDDPLVLKEEDAAAYKARVVYVFKQAVMALRFWPEIWFEASEFCFTHGLDKEGNDFITQGMAANPESCLLAFKRADRLEYTLAADEGDEGLKRRGATVREPYDKVLDALYDLVAKAKAREAQEIARIEETASSNSFLDPNRGQARDDDDEEANDADKDAKEAAKQAQIKIVQDGVGVHVRILSRTISFAWIALMRAMRRIQGKGKVGDMVGGSRQIFTDARKRGRLTSDVYVASALIEYHCYKDPAATKIFERGMKLFPEDEAFALEYLQHLIATNDITNARAVFETTVSKLAQKPETSRKAKPIYQFFHAYESHYGELSQVNKLEKRMADLFPEDPLLSRFAHRHTIQGFDPTAVRPIISPATQTRPKALPSIERHTPVQNSPVPPFVQPTNSPKRPLPSDEPEAEVNRPRKLPRGESPLKGAAGRRLDQQKRNMQSQLGPGHGQGQGSQNQWANQFPPPAPLPREVLFLLSIIPRADTYPPATRFKAEEMVRLLQETEIPIKPPPQMRPSSMGVPQSGMSARYSPHAPHRPQLH